MADDDMPPPLEDMTETLEQARKLKGLRLNESRTPAPTSTTHGHLHSSNKTSATLATDQKSTNANLTSVSKKDSSVKPLPSKKAGSGDFGGLKKGFLFGASKASPASDSQTTKSGSQKNKTESGISDVNGKTDSIPLIKPKTQEKDSGLKLDEVQQAMDSTKDLSQFKDWVTDDLLEKVQKNETLAKHLVDPRFMQAVTEFQTNPKAAAIKYQNNPEMMKFLKEFCGILGEHFTSLGDQQGAQVPSSKVQNSSSKAGSGPKITELTDEDVLASNKTQESNIPVDPKVQQILSDPENQEILMDPKIQQFFQSLRSDPEKAQRVLREGDEAFRQKVDRLISLGLLKFQAS